MPPGHLSETTRGGPQLRWTLEEPARATSHQPVLSQTHVSGLSCLRKQNLFVTHSRTFFLTNSRQTKTLEDFLVLLMPATDEGKTEGEGEKEEGAEGGTARRKGEGVERPRGNCPSLTRGVA